MTVRVVVLVVLVGSCFAFQQPGVPSPPLREAEDRLTRYSDDGFTLSTPTRYSVADWAANLRTLPTSTVLARVRSHLAFNVAWATSIATLYSWLPGLQGIDMLLPLNLSGGILGILLAFRTSQSYERFWHGRQIWAKVVNRARALARLSASYVTADDDAHRDLVRWVVAFPVALKQHLRGERIIADFKSVREADRRALEACDNLPHACCYALSAEIDAVRRSDQAAHGLLWWQMESLVNDLQDCIGEAEAIAGTPVPLSYSRHTSRLLSLWTLCVPLVLVTCFPLPLIPLATGIISWMLLATEELGHIIEEPFGIHSDRPQVLPLERYCQVIERDLDEDNDIIRRAKSSKWESPPSESTPADPADADDLLTPPPGRPSDRRGNGQMGRFGDLRLSNRAYHHRLHHRGGA